MSLSSIIGQASRGADLYFVFRFLRLLTMKYENDALNLDIIDNKGKALKKSADLESTQRKSIIHHASSYGIQNTKIDGKSSRRQICKLCSCTVSLERTKQILECGLMMFT